MTKTTFSLLVLITSLFTLACQQEAPAESATEKTESAQEAPSVPPAEVEIPAEETVEFEPAYPEDVSAEGLSTEDISQQETQHSHDGGEAHSHGDNGTHDDPH